MSGEHLDKLLADLKARAVRQALKGQLIRGWEWENGVVGAQKIDTAHLLVDGKLVRLTIEQLEALKEE
jgi:hypothetical protein